MHGLKNRIVLVGLSSLALVWIVTAVSGAKQQATFYINGNGSVAQVEPKHFVSSPGSACARPLGTWILGGGGAQRERLLVVSSTTRALGIA